jgi:DNA-binding PadR family transcriptional regulator
MGEFNADGLRDTLDFFILNRFSNGPLSLLELQQRLQQVFALLDAFAVRKGKQIPGPLQVALERLEHDGRLKVEQSARPVTVYSLTDAGEHWLKLESTRRAAIVSQFVEEGELHKSFRKFLDPGRDPNAN